MRWCGGEAGEYGNYCIASGDLLLLWQFQCDALFMTIYHGSQNIIEQPQFGVGNPRNDYGLGFYCTRDIGLAKEWACQKNADGFANEYRVDLSGLSLLDLSDDSYTILHWLCILMQNRLFYPKTPLGKRNLDVLLQDYRLEYGEYDVIYGYRANDSYFTFASDFLENAIPIQSLASSMKLGELGMQVVLKSERAFDRLSFVDAHRADKAEFFSKYKQRDTLARKSYLDGLRQVELDDAVYIVDILRKPELLYGLEL